MCAGLLAGGMGVTPMINLSHVILKNPNDKVKVRLMDQAAVFSGTPLCAGLRPHVASKSLWFPLQHTVADYCVQCCACAKQQYLMHA